MSAVTSRAEQRRRTEERILAAARAMFAEVGYERTTIRAVAAAAGVDGGLVMHYFGSKHELFARAVRVAAEEPLEGSPADVAEAMLASLERRLADEPVGSLVVLRSMLTHDEAAEGFRAAALPRLEQLAAALQGPDAHLRAGLITAIVHGVIVERYLLHLAGLEEADPQRVVDLLRPCIRLLAGD
ncbi:TetR family transcriptional regulator [Dactylosporangium sp. NPDC051485]|uniref:TetR/AcrR family transcriptional regulator n=1 Tax=Dactylosporangium sp. NPDC051485 TaxID=3154846 RepID=UPI0034498A1D